MDLIENYCYTGYYLVPTTTYMNAFLIKTLFVTDTQRRAQTQDRIQFETDLGHNRTHSILRSDITGGGGCLFEHIEFDRCRREKKRLERMEERYFSPMYL